MHNLISENKLVTIPKKFLLYVYLIVPLLLVITLVDIFYLNSLLLPYMGIEAILLPLFIFVFNLPHIIASFFSFFDSEYITYYKKHLFIYLPLLLVGTGLLLYVDYKLGLVFFLINDVWHGIKQKVGIALILGAKPGWLHKVWTFFPFITSAVAFIYFILPTAYPPGLIPYISPTLFVGALFIIATMIVMMWTSAKNVRLYIFLVSTLFLVSYFFILSGYIFFAILAFRFVHDLSAFAFYVAHDHNRLLSGGDNWLYRIFKIIPAPVLVLTPILAYLFAYVVRNAADGIAIGYSIVILICMSHYYLESVMWKRNSLHRQFVQVK